MIHPSTYDPCTQHTHTHTHTHRSLLSRILGLASPRGDDLAAGGQSEYEASGGQSHNEASGAERRKKIKSRGSARHASYVFEVVHADGVQYRKSPHFNARLFSRKWSGSCVCARAAGDLCIAVFASVSQSCQCLSLSRGGHRKASGGSRLT